MTAPVREEVFDADISGRMLDVRLLRRLLGWLAPERARLAASTLLVLASSLLQVMLPIILSLVVIDHVLMGTARPSVPDFGLVALTERLAATLQWPLLVVACTLFALVQIAAAATGHWHRVTLANAVIRGLTDLRHAVFRHLLHQPAAFWDRVAVGRVTTRVTNDVESLYELLRGLGALVGEFVPFFVALAIMLAADPGMTLALLVFAPVLGGLTFGFRRLTRRVYRRARQSLSQLNQQMQENLTGLTVVQLHGREAENFAHYTETNRRNRRDENRAMGVETLYAAINDSLGNIAVALVLWMGAKGVGDDSLSLGTLVLFTRYIDLLFQPIVALGDQYNLLFRAMASGERIFQALDWPNEAREPSRPEALPERLAGRIELRHLSFAYGKGPPVLEDVDLIVPARTTLAIVGPTGSGKSTLVRLLARIYEVEAGQVFIDGQDVTRVAARDLRRRIGIVLQDFHVFSGTILDNITLGDADIDRETAIAAARAVGADDFIEALPQGYDTPLSERGRNLSQGQRQLLAFARVLAADPEILVLDEATASIDPETEAVIQRALERLRADRTAIIIAHRLQTVRDADRVLVLVNGRVEGIGDHAHLLEQSPTYARLYAMQFQDS
ncbi:MAG: ABC transporter ATP-binding protein [Pseudomonadales bacterium]|jgi:ATP-binding cassette subfamily B protein|nr:ABC transporter ATP-binding protein [Pseudomonadales bacterium]